MGETTSSAPSGKRAQSNLARYQGDLQKLIDKGEDLKLAMVFELDPEQVKAQVEKKFGKEEGKKLLADLPKFGSGYQAWYSEAKAVIRQILPDRLDDFVRHYEKVKGRKTLSYDTYRMEDYLQGLRVTGWNGEKVVGPDAGAPHFEQQRNILKSASMRFESSLFEIRQLVQADLFDSELEVANELAQKNFLRAAGAVAGVVLEGHLAQVCDSHKVAIAKKAPGISDLNDLLKAASVLDVPQWRFIQHLGDLRNLCDHDKKIVPTPEQVRDLIAGVEKVIKTIY